MAPMVALVAWRIGRDGEIPVLGILGGVAAAAAIVDSTAQGMVLEKHSLVLRRAEPRLFWFKVIGMVVFYLLAALTIVIW